MENLSPIPTTDTSRLDQHPMALIGFIYALSILLTHLSTGRHGLSNYLYYPDNILITLFVNGLWSAMSVGLSLFIPVIIVFYIFSKKGFFKKTFSIIVMPVLSFFMLYLGFFAVELGRMFFGEAGSINMSAGGMLPGIIFNIPMLSVVVLFISFFVSALPHKWTVWLAVIITMISFSAIYLQSVSMADKNSPTPIEVGDENFNFTHEKI
jgi:hypothetical protein